MTALFVAIIQQKHCIGDVSYCNVNDSNQGYRAANQRRNNAIWYRRFKAQRRAKEIGEGKR